MTPTGNWRFSVLRFYWDGEREPSVEVPAGDFFAAGWGRYGQIFSLAVCVNPYSGLNSYWQMPFRKSARITMENIDTQPMTLYYQVDYTLTDVASDMGYFHAQFRRSNPLPYKTDHVHSGRRKRLGTGTWEPTSRMEPTTRGGGAKVK